MPVEDVTMRRREVIKIMTALKKAGKRVNRHTIKDELEKKGITISEVTVYRDLTIINRENTWVRDLSESNYSAYQEEIADMLYWTETQAQKHFELTNNHVWLNVITKVQEIKMKHTNGDNINISAASLTKKFNKMNQMVEKQLQVDSEKVDVIELANTR